MNKHSFENATFHVKESSSFLSKLFEIFFVDLYDSSHHDIKSKTSFVTATQNLDDSLRKLDEMFNGKKNDDVDVDDSEEETTTPIEQKEEDK
jgi:hypothetical protein